MIKLSNYYYSEAKDTKKIRSLPLQDNTNIAIDLNAGEYEETSSHSLANIDQKKNSIILNTKFELVR